MHLRDFGIVIPRVEFWACDDCDKALGYCDGRLVMAGEGFAAFDRVRIPEGYLYIFKEVGYG
jgi:hypothetical protein